MARYEITFRDERGVQDLELDDVQLEDGMYELWRGKEAINGYRPTRSKRSNRLLTELSSRRLLAAGPGGGGNRP